MDNQAIINTMEVLETKPISELVSEAIIKVCYVSDAPNPNNTVITKAVGREIAASLPGAPVAGFFNKETGDFEEHSRKITFQDGKFDVEDITKPYGFVSPTDKPWYQDFQEEGTIRTYLMCKAYLWTRQYEEASLAFGKGQSMELEEKSMAGYYQGDVFVFTTATLDKLCILGDNFAPCFSGAKIMTTYAKQYESLAEKLENIIGRRYYVMNDQLAPKPEKVTLEYALQLGWDLTDAVYLQLKSRGSEYKYAVNGIFTEDGIIFAILQDRETLEFLRCDIQIYDQGKVELAADMVAVTQVWTPKPPAEPSAPEPLNGAEAVAEQEVPMNVAAVYTEGTGEEPGEAKADPANPTAPATEFTEGNDGGKTPETTPGVTLEAKPETKFTEEGAEGKPAEGEIGEIPPATDFSGNTNTATDAAPAQPQENADPIDYAHEYSVLTAKVAEYTTQLETYKATIEELTNTVKQYKEIESAAIEAQKQEVITSYSALLTEDEIKSSTVDIANDTVESLEAKLAVTYARKQKAATPAVQYQVDIAAVETAPELPSFMKQALEFDKAKEIKI